MQCVSVRARALFIFVFIHLSILLSVISDDALQMLLCSYCVLADLIVQPPVLDETLQAEIFQFPPTIHIRETFPYPPLGSTPSGGVQVAPRKL